MSWIDRIARLAVIGNKLTVLADNLGGASRRIEDHERRLTRVETIIEIARPDGMTLRIATARAAG